MEKPRKNFFSTRRNFSIQQKRIKRNVQKHHIYPPLLTLPIISVTSMRPCDLCVDCITAIIAFDTLHKDDSSFPDAASSCRKIIQFLWAAAHDLISITVSITQNSGLVKNFKDKLQDKFILSKSISPPDSSKVSGPSDATLSTLSGSIQHLTSHLEKDSDDKKANKESKKNKFAKLPESSQRLILFASSKSETQERPTVNPEFEKFLEQTSLSRARTHLNQVLSSFGCHIDANPILVASIMAGDLIWTKTSHTPEKFTIFLMAKPKSGSSGMSQKDWLKLHLQEANSNQGFDNSIMDKLSEFKFDYPRSLSELRHFVDNMTGVARLIFYGNSVAAVSLNSWVDLFDSKELLFEMQFDVDPLFGLKICLTIDRSFQLFLQSCQDASDFDEVNFRYLDFSFDQDSIERGRFSCVPPPPLLALFQAATPSVPNGVPSKKRRLNALAGSGQEEEQPKSIITNTNKNPDWILSENEQYSQVFPRSVWKQNLVPSMNGGDKLCCPRLNGRGYCFDNCNRSHDKMNQATAKKYDHFQKKCRSDAK